MIQMGHSQEISIVIQEHQQQLFQTLNILHSNLLVYQQAIQLYGIMLLLVIKL